LKRGLLKEYLLQACRNAEAKGYEYWARRMDYPIIQTGRAEEDIIITITILEKNCNYVQLGIDADDNTWLSRYWPVARSVVIEKSEDQENGGTRRTASGADLDAQHGHEAD
jgi:hypothetical protein